MMLLGSPIPDIPHEESTSLSHSFSLAALVGGLTWNKFTWAAFSSGAILTVKFTAQQVAIILQNLVDITVWDNNFYQVPLYWELDIWNGIGIEMTIDFA